MTAHICIRPAGLVTMTDAVAEVRGAVPLAGGWLAFTAVETAERVEKRVVRRLFGLGDLFERDWGRATSAVSAAIDAASSSRTRLAGLALDRPRIMGIVNVTPDSFSDGGRLGSAQAAIDHGLRLVEAGADILDIGGESTRPGSETVPVAEELRRVLPVIEGLKSKTDARISVDTRKADVMRRASVAGADMINDVSALTFDPAALETAAESGLPVVLMHAQGDPKTMQDAPHYDDVLLDVYDFLADRISACIAAGIPRERIVVDPGIGFGKTLEHNLQLMSGLSLFHALGVPVMLGASRKRFIGALTGEVVAAKRVQGSVAAAIAGAAEGCQIVRVHDVTETKQALAVWLAARSGRHQV